jgi:hypothetical protein
MSNSMQIFKIINKDINKILEGRVHCINFVEIEIPIGKCQRIQERIMLIEMDLRSSHT